MNVAVTGASGFLGRNLLPILSASPSIEGIIALDVAPPGPDLPKVAYHRVDLASLPGDIFAGDRVDAVLHLAFHLRTDRRRRLSRDNRAGTRAVLESCERARVPNIIFLSSHTVYGAHPHNSVPITEDTPADPLPGFGYAEDKSACEELVLEYAVAHPDVTVTILRSCVVLGPGSAGSYVARTMFKPVLLRLMGYDPPLQFVHVDDLTLLLLHLAIQPAPGTFNVAGAGSIPYSRAAGIASSRLLPLPVALAYPLVGMTWRLGLQGDSPAIGLEYIRHPILLDTAKLTQATGFQLTHSSESALRAAFPDR